VNDNVVFVAIHYKPSFSYGGGGDHNRQRMDNYYTSDDFKNALKAAFDAMSQEQRIEIMKMFD
jgi:hypothetical protein